MGKISSEKIIVDHMISLYCLKKHGSKVLCADCEALKNYAMERLSKCPFGDDKTACVDCVVHCYQTARRAEIRSVMRFSGPRMLLYYPKDFFKHLLKK